VEYRDGDYRYPAPYETQPQATQGGHPYAAYSAPGYGDDATYTRSAIDDFGYGDPGYSDPGYDGPAAEDAGVAGTRTVRGFVEPGQGGYGQGGYPPPGHAPDKYGGPGQIEFAYPVPEAGPHQGPGGYREQWNYNQPLRYEGEEPVYPAAAENYGPDYGPGAYDPADYNGSSYSRPGIDGPGYDLSGIIETGDFQAAGYDEPSYGRLSYDDPRYGEAPGYGDARRGGRRSPETRFDMPRLDETRMDLGGGATARSEYPGTRFDDTRFDLRPVPRMDHTRFDVPVYDETRVDMRAARGGVLAPPEEAPPNWAEETSLDTFDGFSPDSAQVPVAFARPAELEAEDDTLVRRGGRRRGRSGDRKQWMALGAIAVVAAGAIGGVLMKYVFSGPSGPAHTVVAPNKVDAFTREPNLEKQFKVGQLRDEVMKLSGGQATDLQSGVYQQGSGAPGSNTQIYMFVGGHLASANPQASIDNFVQTYRGKVVSAGPLGGEVACAEATNNGESVATCVWFDNDSFGELVSPTMTPAKLATTLASVRPNLELYAR
jgi:hypothetical protein